MERSEVDNPTPLMLEGPSADLSSRWLAWAIVLAAILLTIAAVALGHWVGATAAEKELAERCERQMSFYIGKRDFTCYAVQSIAQEDPLDKRVK